jgi:hypothetical protein
LAASRTTCIKIEPRFTARVSVSGTTYIEIGPTFTTRVSASGIRDIEMGSRSISVVPELTP